MSVKAQEAILKMKKIDTVRKKVAKIHKQNYEDLLEKKTED